MVECFYINRFGKKSVVFVNDNYEDGLKRLKGMCSVVLEDPDNDQCADGYQGLGPILILQPVDFKLSR